MKIAITGHRPNKLNNDYDLKSPLIQAITDRIVDILVSSSPSMSISYKRERATNTIVDKKIENITGITGMALGIDQLYAKICIQFNIPFIAAIPFKGQESMWPSKSKVKYYELLLHAKYIYIVDEKRYANWKEFEVYTVDPTRYSPDKMQKRNEWMIDQLTEPEDKLIAVWDGSSGGTANCVKYAQEQLLKKIDNKILTESNIIRIDPKQIILET